MPAFSVSKQEKTEGVENIKSIDFSLTFWNVVGMFIKTTEKFFGGYRYDPTDSVRNNSKVGPHFSITEDSENSPVETTPTIMSDPFRYEPITTDKKLEIRSK
jgi:hypothetical protein